MNFPPQNVFVTETRLHQENQRLLNEIVKKLPILQIADDTKDVTLLSKLNGLASMVTQMAVEIQACETQNTTTLQQLSALADAVQNLSQQVQTNTISENPQITTIAVQLASLLGIIETNSASVRGEVNTNITMVNSLTAQLNGISSTLEQNTENINTMQTAIITMEGEFNTLISKQPSLVSVMVSSADSFHPNHTIVVPIPSSVSANLSNNYWQVTIDEILPTSPTLKCLINLQSISVPTTAQSVFFQVFDSADLFDPTILPVLMANVWWSSPIGWQIENYTAFGNQSTTSNQVSQFTLKDFQQLIKLTCASPTAWLVCTDKNHTPIPLTTTYINRSLRLNASDYELSADATNVYIDLGVNVHRPCTLLSNLLIHIFVC